MQFLRILFCTLPLWSWPMLHSYHSLPDCLPPVRHRRRQNRHQSASPCTPARCAGGAMSASCRRCYWAGGCVCARGAGRWRPAGRPRAARWPTRRPSPQTWWDSRWPVAPTAGQAGLVNINNRNAATTEATTTVTTQQQQKRQRHF